MDEVLRIAKYIKSCIDADIDCTVTIDKSKTHLVLNALNKQIPKKPMLEGDGYDYDGDIIYDTWICTNCGKDYEVEFDDYNFCPECGQAIDTTNIKK